MYPNAPTRVIHNGGMFKLIILETAGRGMDLNRCKPGEE